MSPSEQPALIFDTPHAIEGYKLATVKYGLRLQQAGIKLGPLPRTPLQVLQKDYGFKGRTIAKGLIFVEALLASHLSQQGTDDPPANPGN